jgi:hypothetical protein
VGRLTLRSSLRYFLCTNCFDIVQIRKIQNSSNCYYIESNSVLLNRDLPGIMMIRLSSSRSSLTSGPCMPSLLRISTCYLPKSGCRISCRSLLIFLLIRMSFLKSGRGRFVVIAIRCYFNPVTTSKVRTSHRVLELIARGHRRTWMKEDTITMRGSRNLSVKSPRTMRAARTRTSTQNKKSFKCTLKGMKILSRFNLDGQYDNN